MMIVNNVVGVDNLHLELLRDLVSFRTITPAGRDAIEYCSEFLRGLGFQCLELQYGEVSNLYARLGASPRNICFAGHVDVVPPHGIWATDPFVLHEVRGALYGRGVNDMKGPLSSALAAISDFVGSPASDISISVLLTSDEEIMGDDGSKRVVEFLRESGERITGAILCESCSPGPAGEYIKIGCRGSLNVDITSRGMQCHVVNGGALGNHIHSFIGVLMGLSRLQLDDGTEDFTRSDLEVTSIDVGNEVRNLIPGSATAKLNIRFNDLWTFDRLEALIKEAAQGNEVSFQRFGAPIICRNREFIEFLAGAIRGVIGRSPDVGTIGGNSDAFFIRDITDVVEIGSPLSEAHIENEFINHDALIRLRNIYRNILHDFARTYV
jgi:succinyl-diaminopimelate desuccinylase